MLHPRASESLWLITLVSASSNPGTSL